MVLIILRTLIVFLALLILMRLMGKRQIGEMQPYELVVTLIIAEIACVPMSDPTIPLSYGLASIVAVYFLHQLVCLIDLIVPKAKKILSGTPSIVINKDGIDHSQLKKNNLDLGDLIESMRGAGYFSLDDVDYALYEANGSFSALPKTDKQEGGSSMPVLLIDSGRFIEKNVQLTGREKEYYLNVLRGQGLNELKKVLVMTVDGRGKVYAQEKGGKYQTFTLDWDKELW